MSAQASGNRKEGNGALAGHTARDLVEQSARVREDVVALAGAVRQVTHGWEALVRDRLERRPYATLAVAAGLGYVLGGGIPTGLVRLLLGLGGRFAFEQAIARLSASDTNTSS